MRPVTAGSRVLHAIDRSSRRRGARLTSGARAFPAETLRRDHVDAPRIATLPVDASLAQLIEALHDPWTRVLDPDDAKAFLQEVSGGATVGVGLPEFLSIDIDARSGAKVIVTPLPGSPAARAGLVPGDRVASIDGVSTEKLPFAEVMRKLRGAAGSTVTLGIRHGLVSREVTLLRAELPAQDTGVEAASIDRVLHLRIRRFGETTPDAVAAALGRFARIPVLLDLRDNPGGALDSALQIAGLFAGKVPVAAMQSAQEIRKLSGTRVALGKRRVAVIVHQGTGSAAELLATALASVSSAKVIGAPTIGKCLVHTVARGSTTAGCSFSPSAGSGPFPLRRRLHRRAGARCEAAARRRLARALGVTSQLRTSPPYAPDTAASERCSALRTLVLRA